MTIAGNQAFLKTLNRNALLRLLYEHPGATKASLARLSSLTKMTVGALTQELKTEGWLLEGQSLRGQSLGTQGATGRPGSPLSLNPHQLCTLGAEIAVDYVMIVACNLLGEVVAQFDSPRAPLNPDDAVRTIAEGVRKLQASPSVRTQRILGLGVSAPGPVEAERLRFAPNLQWGETHLLGLLRPALALSDAPVILENEANAAAIGEYFYRLGAKPRSLVYLSLGVGVGCGLVIQGEVFRGAGGFAGEVGHTILYPPSGSTEDFVSQRALAGQLGYRRIPRMADILKRAASRPEAVNAVGRDLGLLLVNLVNTFSPDELVVGGPLSRLGDALLQPALEVLHAHEGRWQHLEAVRVKLCDKRDRAAAIGAAGAVLHSLLQTSR